MNMTDLFVMQKQFDAMIIEKHNLQGVDLMENLVVALQTEIGELANEWRGFKHWSENQEPRTKSWRNVDKNFQFCDEYNPLLEEYVDCLSFALAIANAAGYTDDILYTFDDLLEGSTQFLFVEMNYRISEFLTQTDALGKRRAFRMFMYIFINIGAQRFGFKWDEIVTAYCAKNEINRKRQGTVLECTIEKTE